MRRTSAKQHTTEGAVGSKNPKQTASNSYDTSSLEATSPAVELIFGFVGPTGIDLNAACDSLCAQLKTLQYDCIEIRLSGLISEYMNASDVFRDEYERISVLMSRGTELREQTSSPEIVARLAVAAIRDARRKITGAEHKTADRVAYIIRSFKRPEEVSLFRQVYGKAFTLISVYAPRTWRLNFLRRAITPSLGRRKSDAEKLAVELINRDYDEEERELGQKVGKTFPLADYFVTSESRPELDKQLKRLVQLTFGHPYISPTSAEQAMFFAKAAAMRSLDLSRQVGAAVISDDGELLTTGCNEVPKFGGGLYWADNNPDRDYERGCDSNVDIKRAIVEDAFERLRREKLLKVPASRTSSELANEALFSSAGVFKDSLLFDVIEFGRAVHAEMAAISQAARLGISLQGGTLYCTTFPCHICSRHIVASGIKNVIFVEPYEKSRTAELYRDSISIEPAEPSANRVNFHSFVGVAPRRYADFFEATGTRKTLEGKIRSVEDHDAAPRLKRLILTYIFTEAFVIKEMPPSRASRATRRPT